MRMDVEAYRVCFQDSRSRARCSTYSGISEHPLQSRDLVHAGIHTRRHSPQPLVAVAYSQSL